MLLREANNLRINKTRILNLHKQMKYIIIVISSIFILNSCSNTTQEEVLNENIIVDKEAPKNSEHNSIVKKIFYNVPSPLEISTILQQSGVDYNSNFLNSFNKVNNYTTLEEMSINLGVYGADLSYNRLYDQIHESVNYFSAIKKLSDNLGIPQIHGGSAAERLEKNLENRDSLLTIISQTYSSADEYLKLNDRGNIASLIVLGGWIEALYIATQIASSPGDNDALIKTIAEQKLSLENLMGLLSTYKDDEIVSVYIEKLEVLQLAYSKVEITHVNSSVTTDSNLSLTTIDNETTVVISDETFVEILTIISNIRNELI